MQLVHRLLRRRRLEPELVPALEPSGEYAPLPNGPPAAALPLPAVLLYMELSKSLNSASASLQAKSNDNNLHSIHFVICNKWVFSAFLLYVSNLHVFKSF